MTAARRSYREAYEREVAHVLAKEARVDALLSSLLRAKLDRVQTGDGLIHLRLSIDVTPHLLEHVDMYEMIARRVVEGLAGLHNDHRPDMREADKPRLLSAG